MESNQEEVPPASTSPKRTVTIKDDVDEKKEEKESFIEKFKATSTPWKIALSSFLIGFLFHVIAYGSPYWINVSDVTGNDVMFMGPWMMCTSISNCTMRRQPAGCLNSARGVGGVALLLCLLVCALLVKYILRPDQRRCVGTTAMTTCSVIALCSQILTGVLGRTSACCPDIYYGSSYDISWSWSIALSFLSFICFSTSAIFFWVQELRTCAKNRPKWRTRIGPRIRIT